MANPYFNAVAYLQQNPDVMAAGYTVDNAEQHYLQYGANEALLGNASRNPAPYFDVAYYLNGNPDLIAAGIGADGAFAHFTQYGQYEGRSPSNGLSITEADLEAYAAANEDLQEAFGIEDPADLTEEQQDALTSHFYQYGYAEDRPGAPFDVDTNPGENFSLTTSADNIEGTNGDDVITAAAVNQLGTVATTLQAFDTIDGGAGRDTLNIYSAIGGNNDQAGTIKNVEVINIDNSDSNFANRFAAGNLDASKFEGAEEINQIGQYSKVTKLADGVVAGFKDLVARPIIAVEAADTATSVNVAMDNVTFDNATDTLKVSGKLLDTVNVAGGVVTAAGKATEIALEVSAGTKVKALNINTEADAVLTTAGAAAVTSINAAESTGDITYAQAGAVDSITTGEGDDDITVTTATGKTVTVDTGAGDDDIALTIVAGKGYNINAGDGDDEVEIVGGTVATTHVIDGGEGIDTIVMAGKAAYIADDYVVLNKVLTNFEVLEFASTAGGTTAFDASQAAGYEGFAFANGGSITKVAADQALGLDAGTLNATAAGYVAGNNGATPPTTTTYAGSLDISVEGDASTVNAFAESVALTVEADTGAGAGNVGTTLSGDVKTATVELENGVDTNTDAFTVASVTVTTATTATAGAYTALGGLESLTLTGNGVATVTNVVGTSLVTVDASALASVDADGEATAGLTYTSDNAKAETITLGASNDTITLNASTYAATDTITGFDVEADALDVGGLTGFVKFESTQTDLDLLLKDAAAETANNLVFQFEGNTYIYGDTTGAGTLDNADVLVKLTGAIDLDDLIGIL